MTRRAGLRGSVADRRGAAVVEFALTAPLLALLLVGLFDLAPSMMIRFKLGSAAATVADLATQSATAKTSDFLNFFGAGSDVMAPFSGTPLSLRISNVASDGNNKAFIYWSCASGSMSPLGMSPIKSSIKLVGGLDVTTILQMTQQQGNFNLNGTNTSMIVVEAAYTYKSPAGLIFPAPQNLTSAAFAMPRVSTFIGPTTGAVGYVPPFPTVITNVYPYAAGGVSCNFGY